ncbi:MAG: EAL domain-containing protein [Actinomycetota bacterium]|nr:EAL domain-containing protein [Actinomycetota bacterium]
MRWPIELSLLDEERPVAHEPVDRGDHATEGQTRAELASRLAAAEDTLRAIGAGEIDAFVVAGDEGDRRLFTVSTADRPYRMFVENMRDGAATVSPAGVILYANRRLAELLSCSREEILGSPIAKFLAPEALTRWEDIRAVDDSGAAVETELVDAAGGRTVVLIGASLLEGDGDQLTCLTFTDLSAQKAQDREIVRLGQAQAERMADLQDAQAALTKQATHDALTGLPNRDLLVDRLNQALLQARRSGRCIAVYFVDVDRFKLVNDTQGHAVGNTVLRRVAERLVTAVRGMDTVARIGGDEFVVLAPDVGNHLQAMNLGDRLVAALCWPADSVDEVEQIAASVGIAVSEGGRGTAETLLYEADMAMYKAKSLGGARNVVFDESLARQVTQRSAAQQTLEAAIDGERIIAFYQPIVDMAGGTVTGFEALVRIVEPDATVLAPSAFIAVAEETGLVLPLGARVLDLACHEVAAWNRDSGRRSTVAVNVSSRQFEPGDLTSILRRALDGSGLDPELLHIELTETAIMDLGSDIVQQLHAIRDLGVQIGLDDFGTGYASLTHLRRLPLAFVKIDQSFVQGLGMDQEDDRIVSAVVDLARNLGLRSIAEGVETDSQLGRLRELGCDQAQGYLFAKPMPAEAVPTTLSTPHRW